jgi:DNA-binding XRE family transcriptional regulator
LHKDVQDELLAHAALLEQFGPQLGRPRVDTLNGSRHSNMKELRFDASGGVRNSRQTLRRSRRPDQESQGKGAEGKEVRSMTNLEQIRKGLSPTRRKKIDARAAELIAEEMTLQELRRARELTQVRMAKKLGVSQDGISKLEKRSDLLLSTLRKTVEAMGGRLSLVAEFPDRKPVVLSAGSEDEPNRRAHRPKRARSHA